LRPGQGCSTIKIFFLPFTVPYRDTQYTLSYHKVRLRSQKSPNRTLPYFTVPSLILLFLGWQSSREVLSVSDWVPLTAPYRLPHRTVYRSVQFTAPYRLRIFSVLSEQHKSDQYNLT
jgi:hypothetical protein